MYKYFFPVQSYNLDHSQLLHVMQQLGVIRVSILSPVSTSPGDFNNHITFLMPPFHILMSFNNLIQGIFLIN